MRGKLFERYILGNWVRITPADAGKTVRSRERMDEPWDHPRGCGENGSRHKVWDAYEGSPPRMRGKRHTVL